MEKFKSETLQLIWNHRLFILCAMLCAFCITADYGIVRPVSNSIFLSTYGSDFFPYAWIAIVPLNFLLVELYNRFLARWGIYRMFVTIALTIAVVNTLCAFFMARFSFVPFFFYIWKEIYVMLLFQQLWSVIHSTMQMQSAKIIYGIIFAMGGVGGIVGSILPSYFAVKMGSPNLLLGSVPILTCLVVAFTYLLRYSTLKADVESPQQINNFKQGIIAIKNSKYLSFILMIVLLMQVTTTLIYYQFNTILEMTIPEQDLRTEYCGKVFGIVNIVTVLFQLFGSFLFIHFFGLRRSHLLLPLILSFNAFGSLIIPGFAMISAAFITIKAFDFSLFGILKEMLYIPLKKEEKFQAKAIIDVFAYRSAKALASCMILVLQSFGLVQLLDTLSWGTVLLFILWSVIVYKMFQLKDENVVPEINP